MANYGSVPIPVRPALRSIVAVVAAERVERRPLLALVAATYCRSSSQIGQAGGGSALPANCVPQVAQTKLGTAGRFCLNRRQWQRSTASTGRRTSTRSSGRKRSCGRSRTRSPAGQVRQAYLFAGPRGTGKTSMARILAKALNCAQGPTPTPRQHLPLVPRDRGRHVARRGRDGRRLAARDRRHPRDPRPRRAAAGRGPLQGLHPRRGAPAHRRGLERAAEADRGAAAAPRLRLLHHRPGEDAADRPLALPDVRLPAAAAARARARAAPGRRRRGDRGAGRALCR